LNVSFTEHFTFVFNLPLLKVPVEIRLLTGKDETFISQKVREAQAAKKDVDSLLSLQLKIMVVSINNISDRSIINEAIGLLPAMDSKAIRQVYQKVSPSMDLSYDFECKACSYEARLEVPFTADFFWPK
jgi:hypothetical protein